MALGACSIDAVTFTGIEDAVCGDSLHEVTEACDDGNAIDGDGCDRDCTITGCGNGIATPGEECDDGNAISGDGCEDLCTRSVSVSQTAYVKASNTGAADQYSWSVALSADGSTMVVGAHHEDSAAKGIDGDQNSSGAQNAGAVYVFTRSGTAWTQQAYLKASNTDPGDEFGEAVALSSDGSTLAVGARGEASMSPGINGDQTNNGSPATGAVYVFTRSGTAWTQQAYIKASNPDVSDVFGSSIALSGDGSTLAVGAHLEDGSATGVGGAQNNNTDAAGAVYLFTRSGTAWTQQAYIKASNTGVNDIFGVNVGLSGDGSILAVGAAFEDSAATGVGGDQSDNTAQNSGAVYVFTRSGTVWTQQAYLKASNTGAGDQFGRVLALSSAGATLAVGAVSEDSSATGVGGDQSSNAAESAGAVYVFERSGAVWSQQAYIKASATGADDEFGWSLALSEDGTRLAAGAVLEDSAATGIDGDVLDNSAAGSGAVYLLQRTSAAWSQRAYIKTSATDAGDGLGYSIALSRDASTLAAGAYLEDSAALGIGGNPLDNSAADSGSVCVYRAL